MTICSVLRSKYVGASQVYCNKGITDILVHVIPNHRSASNLLKLFLISEKRTFPCRDQSAMRRLDRGNDKVSARHFNRHLWHPPEKDASCIIKTDHGNSTACMTSCRCNIQGSKGCPARKACLASLAPQGNTSAPECNELGRVWILPVPNQGRVLPSLRWNHQ